MERGEIPAGLQVDHLCRNKLCVKVEHMELVSQLVNLRRRPNHHPERCKRGHAFDEENTRITAAGSWVCRACNKERAREWRARQRESRAGLLRKQ